MTRIGKIKKIAACILLLLAGSGLFAEIISDQTFGFSLDIPEGYELTATANDNMNLAFNHKNLPVTLAVKIYESRGDSMEVLNDAMKKLGSSEKASIFEWNDSICSVAKPAFSVESTDYQGWAVCAPTSREGYFVTLLCYTQASMANKCEFFIISTINSLKVGGEKSPGIFTQIAYPREGQEDISLNIAGRKIKSHLDKSDAEASSFVINIEFNILTMYANHPLKLAAWKRYYRILERDAEYRLKEAGEDIYKALYADCKKQNAKEADLVYAQTLLSWVQDFEYQQTKGSTAQNMNAGFTSLPAVLEGKGSDCDSRSMLLSVLLSQKNIPCIMLFSPEYAHALAAVKLKAPGQTFTDPKTGNEYLFGETTAKVTWGMIAKEHTDRSKWFTTEE